MPTTRTRSTSSCARRGRCCIASLPADAVIAPACALAAFNLGNRAVFRRDRARRSRRRRSMSRPGKRRRRPSCLAGGCFWGVQGVFQHVEGVTSAVSGYAGGEQATAQYEKVGSGRTGHAEVGARHLRSAQGEPRPAAADLFLGRARSDRAQPPGPGCRPAISLDHLPDDDEQAQRGARPISSSSTRRKVFGAKIVTTIEPGRPFYPAEGYHQDYLTLHPQPALHRDQRPAQGREPEAPVRRRLSRRAGAGLQDRRARRPGWAAARGAGRAPADRGRAATAACGPARGDGSGD